MQNKNALFLYYNKIKRKEDVYMENKNVELLGGIFTASGHDCILNREKWTEEAAICLKTAGADNIQADKRRGQVIFRIGNRRETDISYCLHIKMSSKIFLLEHKTDSVSPNGAVHLMKWYAAKRNESLSRNIQYNLNPVYLIGRIFIKNGDWKKELIKRTHEMNRIIEGDQKILEKMRQGKVPEEIQWQIVKEYREYEGEIRNGIDI
jgi:hypothetical protein